MGRDGNAVRESCISRFRFHDSKGAVSRDFLPHNENTKISTLGLGYPCLKKLQALTRCISFPLLQQCQGSAGLADDLALVRSQIHEFKSVTIAGAAAQDSSNPDRAARDRNGEFQADHCADFPFRDKYSSRPGFR